MAWPARELVVLAAPVLQNVGGAARAAGIAPSAPSSPMSAAPSARSLEAARGLPRAAAVRRRPSAGRRGGRRRGGRAAGSVHDRPWLLTPKPVARPTPRWTRSTAFVVGSARGSAHHRCRGARPAARVPQPPSAARRQRADARRRRSRRRRRAGAGGPGPARHHPAGVEPGVAVARHRRHQRRQHRHTRSTTLIAALEAAEIGDAPGATPRISNGCSSRPRGGRACWSTG